uniref:Uncharacterized protein n=1 Tax=Tetradesmus obliquus TaxID=3088 RepID=A0A383W1F8_TETOB
MEDGLLQAAHGASSQAPPEVHPQQQVQLLSGVSACFEDAYNRNCLDDSAMTQQQLRGELRSAAHQQNHAPQQLQLTAGACAKGNSSSHSHSTQNSTTSGFQSACSLWIPAD